MKNQLAISNQKIQQNYCLPVGQVQSFELINGHKNISFANRLIAAREIEKVGQPIFFSRHAILKKIHT